MELEKYTLFKGLTSVQITKFEHVITRKKVHAKDEIIKEGDVGDSIIFLLEGEVKIYKPTLREWIMIILFILVAINGFYHL